MSAAVKIKKNLQVPPAPKVGRPRKFPFHQLDVGDSFVVDSCVKSVRSSMYLFRAKHQPEWKFQLEVLGETETRVWRVK